MGEGLTDTPQGVGHGGGREASHVPVLLKEAIDFLAVRRGGTYIDATVGLGGHSYEIARRLGAPGHLIGLDKDPEALEIARKRLTRVSQDWPEITLLQRSFAEIAKGQKPSSIDGILADIGVSSLQLDNPARGFSFQAEGPLDMRMDPQSERTAEQVVNHLDERQLADVIYEFGEERRSRRIARAICRSRPIRSTAHLAEVISAAARPMNQAERRIHPATRTFQALRIFVNRELDDLKALLEAASWILKPGGRVVVISFHSLEDRIVKDAFRDGTQKGYFSVLTKKPVTATEEESNRNPRARSAKLRAAEKFSSGKPAGAPGMAVMVVPGKSSGDARRTQIRRKQEHEQGSVVGIQIEVQGMYTGTLISDLMMTAERVQEGLQQERVEQELREIFSMHIRVVDNETAYMGAA